MLEAKLPQGDLLKKLIEAIKDIVNDANWDCNDSGISLQAMDNSHVALVALMLRADGFDPYRCDRNLSLGINVQSMSKILKCASAGDAITLTADDEGETLSFLFEGKNERTSEFELKLMDVDSEHLGIPDSDYDASVTMSSSEFQRICRDLGTLGDSVTISVSKEGVRFSTQGELGDGAITLKSNMSIDDENDATMITLTQPATLMFAVKYLQNFSKASQLSKTVTLNMTNEVPMLIDYKIDDIGYLRYYIAPKIGDDEVDVEAAE